MKLSKYLICLIIGHRRQYGNLFMEGRIGICKRCLDPGRHYRDKAVNDAYVAELKKREDEKAYAYHVNHHYGSV